MARHVSDDANDFPPGAVGGACGANVFAKGVAVGPETLCQSLVDDDYAMRISSVGFGELAAPDNRNAHRFEVIGRTDAISPVEFLSWRRIGHAFDQKSGRCI